MIMTLRELYKKRENRYEWLKKSLNGVYGKIGIKSINDEIDKF